MKLTPFEEEVLDSILWQLEGFYQGKTTLRVTSRILRATLRRIKPKLIGYSENSLKSDKIDIDHAVPLKFVVEKLTTTKSINRKQLLEILETYLVSVKLTHEEHREILKNIGLASKMPDDWDKQDPLARYRKANIRICEKEI